MTAERPKPWGGINLGSPLPPLLRPLGPLLARAYAFEHRRRSRRFDRGKGVVELDRPVVSVGNLSAGGTGKTPMVRRVVDLLTRHARRPAIALRGYASRNGLSDEADEYARTLPAVPRAVGADRVDALLDLFASDLGAGVDCVVLDDGFQHRRLARCFDLVLIDATRPVFADRLLPWGWLREEPHALARAHAIAITRADQVPGPTLSAIIAAARHFAPAATIATFVHAWSGVRVHDGATSPDITPPGVAHPLDWLRGRRLALACAIGNPDAFVAALRAHAQRIDAVLDRTLILRDHDPYEPATIRRVLDLCRGVDALVVTDKDWSKLRRVRADAWPVPVVVPILSMVPREHSGTHQPGFSQPNCDGAAALDRALLDAVARAAEALSADLAANATPDAPDDPDAPA
jgi:tetraacyldisaccharide 4'-kinase